MTAPDRVLYLITCGTLAAGDIGKLVTMAQGAGWTVRVVATPAALDFIDRQALAEQTGASVRHAYKQPDVPDELPPADAVIVGGASFNTINKAANGISDTLALGILNEAIGLGVPVVVLPFLNSALAAHPAFRRSVDALREVGVTVLLGPDVYEPQAPKAGPQALHRYPWSKALEAVEKATATR